MARLKVGALISGRGSNLQALLDACKDPAYPAEIAVVISNKPDAQGLERARQAGVPTRTIRHKDYPDRESFDVALDATLTEAGVELVCLAGFMRLLTPWFVERWHNRLINIHPSLLPAFKGLDTHARALAAGVRFTGCTVHYVRVEMDEGPIVVQAVVPVLPGDDVAALSERVLAAEHRIYPHALRLIAEGRTRVVDDRIEFADPPAAPAPEALINPAG